MTFQKAVVTCTTWNEVLQYWIDKDAELQRTWLERTDERCVEMCGTKYSKTIKTNYAI